MGPTFYEVQKIGSGILAVMARPVAGEWVDDEFAGLAAAGLHQVVSLLEAPEAREVGLAEEAQHCERHGLAFLSFPIPDRGLPPSVDEFAALVRRIHTDTSSGNSTVIHCRAGIGRTGMVAAGVLINAGFDPDDAFTRISERRGVEVPDTREQREWVLAHAGPIGDNDPAAQK